MSVTMTESRPQVRCGNHSTPTYHSSVAEVRACFAGTLPAALPKSVENHPVVIHTADAPTDKQVSFLLSLLAARNMDNGDPEHAEKSIRRLTRLQVSRLIDDTKNIEVPAVIKVGKSVKVDVPSGRYALTGTDGVVKFYKVDCPTEGRWAGRTFVNAQASDELYPIRNAAERSRILSAIAFDPKAAMMLYGTELGSCGHCGRTLTDEDSRARGIGPVCAAKLGY